MKFQVLSFRDVFCEIKKNTKKSNKKISKPVFDHKNEKGVEVMTRSTQTYSAFFKELELEYDLMFKIPHFPIVFVNASDVNSVLFPRSNEAPTIYGVKCDPSHFDEPEANGTTEDQSFVEWVVSGEVEWVDKI